MPTTAFLLITNYNIMITRTLQTTYLYTLFIYIYQNVRVSIPQYHVQYYTYRIDADYNINYAL